MCADFRPHPNSTHIAYILIVCGEHTRTPVFAPTCATAHFFKNNSKKEFFTKFVLILKILWEKNERWTCGRAAHIRTKRVFYIHTRTHIFKAPSAPKCTKIATLLSPFLPLDFPSFLRSCPLSKKVKIKWWHPYLFNQICMSKKLSITYVKTKCMLPGRNG